jgi:hypothetical protein
LKGINYRKAQKTTAVNKKENGSQRLQRTKQKQAHENFNHIMESDHYELPSPLPLKEALLSVHTAYLCAP